MLVLWILWSLWWHCLLKQALYIVHMRGVAFDLAVTILTSLKSQWTWSSNRFYLACLVFIIFLILWLTGGMIFITTNIKVLVDEQSILFKTPPLTKIWPGFTSRQHRDVLSTISLSSWPEDLPGNKTLRKWCYPTFCGRAMALSRPGCQYGRLRQSW